MNNWKSPFRDMPIYDRVPTDSELSKFVLLKDSDLGIRSFDNIGYFKINPDIAPSWIITISIIAPVIIALILLLGNDSIRARIILFAGIPLLLIIAIITILLIIKINKEEENKGPYLVYDKTNKTIIMPRISVQLKLDDVICIISLEGWQKRPGAVIWMRELSLLAHLPDKRIIHLPVFATKDIKYKHIESLIVNILNKPKRGVVVQSWSGPQKPCGRNAGEMRGQTTNFD